MHTIIVANGVLKTLPLPLPPHDLLVAADGGAAHVLRSGIFPGALIGDLDSVSSEDIKLLEEKGARVLRFPADKDETDFELALDYAAGQGAERITCLALFGGRWDMTFANLLLLASPKYAGLRLEILEGGTRMYIIRSGEKLSLSGRKGDVVSVLPLKGPLKNVTYSGLKWPLEGVDLAFGSPLGVSNRLEAERATITIQEGVSLVTLSRQRDAPDRKESR